MLRWLNKTQAGEIVNLYHLARVPLRSPSKYERMIWASKEFSKSIQRFVMSLKATVKGHNEYKGRKQTIITRAKEI